MHTRRIGLLGSVLTSPRPPCVLTWTSRPRSLSLSTSAGFRDSIHAPGSLWSSGSVKLFAVAAAPPLLLRDMREEHSSLKDTIAKMQYTYCGRVFLLRGAIGMGGDECGETFKVRHMLFSSGQCRPFSSLGSPSCYGIAFFWS